MNPLNTTRMAIIGRLGTPQLACLRSWRRQGVPCVFLHADSAPLPRAVAWLLGVRCVHLGELRLEDADFVSRLATVLAAEGVQALTCVSESISVALWACRDRLPGGLRLLSVSPWAARRLASKLTQDRLATSSGLFTLPTWHFRPGSCVEVADVYFPLVLRPDVASQARPAFKVAVVADANALQRHIDALDLKSTGIVAQPLVRGPNLLVHAWRAPGGRLGGQVAFRVDVKHRGLTVLLRPVALDAATAAGCARMAQALGLEGVFHFEFIEDPGSGRAYFLDLNPRLGGTTGKVLAAGYDEPLALLSTLQDLPPPGRAILAPHLRAAGGRHQALAALWSALRGRSTEADYPFPDLGRLLPQLARHLLVGRDELLRADALSSLLGFVLYQLAKRLERRLRRPAPLPGDGAAVRAGSD